jgi:hypothetical protein
LIWAPSYLGPGTVDRSTPHTDNINDVRDYLEAVCTYLGVDVVDVIAHSLGCTLMYSVFRGPAHHGAPIGWNLAGTNRRNGTGSAPLFRWPELSTAWGNVGRGMGHRRGVHERAAPKRSAGWRNALPHRQFADTAATAAQHQLLLRGRHRRPGRRAEPRHRQVGRRDEQGLRPAYGLGSGGTGHRNTNESDAVFNDSLPLLDFAPLLNFVPPVPGSAQAPIEPRRNPLARWWSRLSAWWRQRSR